MTRARIAVAGTSGFIGRAVCEALAKRFEVVALTRSMARGGEEVPGVTLHPCDHYSRKELEAALQGVDYAVYLIHNRDPSSRLDQARTRERDLLVADNFGRAAARAGVKQIVYRAQLLPLDNEHGNELEEVLAGHGVPVTVLRTTLVVGPGGELARLLVRMVRRLPVIPLPASAERGIRPISLADLLLALEHCVGNPAAFGREYRVVGTEPLTFRGLVEDAAATLGHRRRILTIPRFSDRLFAGLLRGLNPSMHLEFLRYLLGTLSSEVPEMANPLGGVLATHAMTFREVLTASVRAEGARGSHQAQRAGDDAFIRNDARVRSIQRMSLPAGRNAAWMADHYFDWLGHLMNPFLVTERDEAGSWTVLARPGRFRMLTLAFKPTHSSPDRMMYFITGGLLARFLGGRTARLEFRDFLGGRFTIVAIHDFNPALPWYFYRFTQAVVHGLVMRGYQRHTARLTATERPL
jgi:uncharacterized protein YbjT (DUF2867 family)